MANAHVALEVQHVAGVENVPDHSVVLAQVQSALIISHHARRVLATVLQNSQTIIDGLVDVTFSNYSYNPAHRILPMHQSLVQVDSLPVQALSFHNCDILPWIPANIAVTRRKPVQMVSGVMIFPILLPWELL